MNTKHLKTEKQRYRCSYTPLTIDGFVIASESGVLPYVDVTAVDAEAAARAAYLAKNAPITEVMRLDDPAPRAKRAARKPRPVIQLITGAALLAIQQAQATTPELAS